MDKDSEGITIDADEHAVPFTARLIAYYRAQESKRENPLIVDPFAKRLAGDLQSYTMDHKRTVGSGDYAIVRAHYVDNRLDESWSENLQIVIIGAGLDTRAYRLKSLKERNTLFEIDFPIINKYKEKILKDEIPFCNVIRISLDFSTKNWMEDLRKAGFDTNLDTFWILEGFAYYLEKETISSILTQIAGIKANENRLFVDLCVPALAELEYGPFARHFKWGLQIEDVHAFFAATGWDVACSYADDFDHGRDVGQRGLLFIDGVSNKTKGAILQRQKGIEVVPTVIEPDFHEVLSNIESIVQLYQRAPEKGLARYVEFLRDLTPYIKSCVEKRGDVLSIGRISPRLLRDPFLKDPVKELTIEEQEAHITGYLRAIIFFVYCEALDLNGSQFIQTPLHKESLSITGLTSIPALIGIVRHAL